LIGLCCETCQEKDNASYLSGINCDLCADKLQRTVNSIKLASLTYDSNNQDSKSPVTHQERLDAIDAFMRCYIFARDVNMAAVTTHMDDELISRLHSAELTIARKEEEVQRLNVEVSICREEIGRLRNAPRSTARVSSPCILCFICAELSAQTLNNHISFLVAAIAGYTNIC
jgi:hypothetical protein